MKWHHMHGTDECSRRANGAIALMDRFAMYFGLKLSILIFSMIEQLSIALQGKSVSVQDGFLAAEVCIRGLKRLRSDDKFRVFLRKMLLIDVTLLFCQGRGNCQGESMMVQPSMSLLL